MITNAVADALADSKVFSKVEAVMPGFLNCDIAPELDVYKRQELESILENGLRLSRVGQVLVERCISGWKEIEYEVMRDSCLLYTSRCV